MSYVIIFVAICSLFVFMLTKDMIIESKVVDFKIGWIISESIRSLSEVFNCSYMTCQNDAATANHQQGNCSQELNGYACMINKVPQTTSKGKVFKINSHINIIPLIRITRVLVNFVHCLYRFKGLKLSL